MPDHTNAPGSALPRPLLSLAAELDAQAAPAPVRARSAPILSQSAPRRARPGALARALAEARARAAAGASAPSRSGVAVQTPLPDEVGLVLRPAASPLETVRPRGRTIALLAGGASLGGALALFLTPALSEHRDLALGALICLALGLAGFAAGPTRPSPRRMPELAPAPPTPPAPSETASAPLPPSPDELRLSLLALRRAMAGGGGETPAEAST